MPAARGPSRLRELVAQMTHLFALMLWIAAALAFAARMPELATAIVVVILLNGTFAFVQEVRAERAPGACVRSSRSAPASFGAENASSWTRRSWSEATSSSSRQETA